MPMPRNLSLALAAVFCLCAAPVAAQTTLDFEYPPPGYTFPVIDGYGGFHWGATSDPGWFGRITTPPGPEWLDPGCAHDGGITCIFNDAGAPGSAPVVSFWRDSPFNFVSLLMKNYYGTPSVAITGWLGSDLVFSTTRALGGSLALQTFDWANVDRVTFATTGNSQWFLADDLTYSQNVVPEPATLLLLGTGLVGVVGAGLLRRKKNTALSD